MSAPLDQMMQAGDPRHRSEAQYETPEKRRLWWYQFRRLRPVICASVLHTTEIQWMLVSGSHVVTAEQHV